MKPGDQAHQSLILIRKERVARYQFAMLMLRLGVIMHAAPCGVIVESRRVA